MSEHDADLTEQEKATVPERILAVNKRLVDERNALRELVDLLWGELPADVVLTLDPDIVTACRINHEIYAHGEHPR